MLPDLVLDLEIELEYAVHCQSDAETFEDFDPDVGEHRIQ